MSGTERKNGSRVEAAANAIALAGEGVWFGHVTLAQIAKASGMSKPTVKKYMDVLVEHGSYAENERDMRYCAKNTPRSYRLVKKIVKGD